MIKELEKHISLYLIFLHISSVLHLILNYYPYCNWAEQFPQVESHQSVYEL